MWSFLYLPVPGERLMKNAPLFPPQCLRELSIQKQRWRVVADQRAGLYSPVPHAPRGGFAVKRLEIHGRERALHEAKGPSCTTATESQTTLKALAPAAPVNYSHRMQKRAFSALPDERAEAKSKHCHCHHHRLSRGRCGLTVRKGDVHANDREWSCRCLCTSKKVEGEKE